MKCPVCRAELALGPAGGLRVVARPSSSPTLPAPDAGVSAGENDRHWTGMTLFSQNDPRWRDQEYAGGVTFGQAGCYVTCVAMVLSLSGYEDTPLEVARRLRQAKCFNGPLLTIPENIPQAYPRMRYDGTVRWHESDAQLTELWTALRDAPVIIEVDYKPGGAFNQHFVVAVDWDEETLDLVIVDPIDGQEAQLIDRYSPEWQNWTLARAIYGMRLLRSGA